MSATIRSHETRLDSHEDRMDTLQVDVTHIRGRVDRLDSKVDGLASRLDGKIDRLDSKIDGLASRLDSKIDGLANRLDSRIDGLARQLEVIVPLVIQMAGKQSLGIGKSPQVLSPLGEELSEAIDAPRIVSENLDELREAVRFSEQANLYDLQTACFALENVYEMLRGEQAEKYKMTAFEKGIDIDLLDRVVAFVLRDRLIDEHPEWSLEKADSQTPSK